MESIGGRTESQIETICRSTRRVKNNSKTIARKHNESMYQNNVDKCSLVQSKVDTNVKDEVAINTSLNARLNGTAANINSATPRRKKDPLANLHSNLSPKYIGYTTPPNQLNSSNEETTRSLRRRHNNSNNTPEDKEKDIGITFTPNSESTVGFVRRTPRSRDSQNTSDKCTKRKDFVSPIDKLLRKNGSVMENNNLPLDDNINSSLNDNVVMNSKNYNEGEIMDLGIKVLEIFDVKTEENKENVSISEENYDEINENNEDEIEFISISSELADEMDDEDEDNDEELENYKVFKSNDHEGITQNNSDNSENESSEDDDEACTQPDENVEDLLSETCLNHDLCETQVNIETPETLIISLSNDTAEEYSKEKESLISEDKTFIQESSDDKKETLEIVLPNNEPVKSKELNKATLVKIESTEHESNQLNVEATSPANSPSAVSMDSAKGSSITNERSWMPFSTGDLYWGQIYNYCYWPCIVCPDPDGKTITTEEISRSGVQKVLVHVRFFADNGRRNWVRRDNLMPYNGIESYQEQILEVGKKYGTKSAKYKLYVPIKRKEPVWQEAVKEANIVAEVPYPKRMEKFYEIFEKSRAFLQLKKQRRKSVYISVNSGTGSDIESFYGSNDNISNLSIAATAMFKQKRERSISPYSPVYSPIKSVSSKRRKLSDQGLSNTAASSEVLAAAVKSEENTTCTDLYLSQNNSIASSSSNSNSLNDMEMFNSLEYKTFYAVMKDYIMEQNHNEKLEKSLVVAVRNIWALKQLGRQQMERKLRESLIENDISSILALENDYTIGVDDVSVKRLSSRLKTLKVRKSLIAQQQLYESFRESSVTPKSKIKRSSSAEKVKKQLNRPILEVIDDIFELNSKYLFKGMSRDPVCKYCFKPGGNLKRCANNCTSWLHNDCLYKDASQKIRRGNKFLNNSTKNKNNNNGNLNGSNSSSIVSLNEVGAVSHITGDFEIQDINNVVCKECANNEPTKCMVCNYTESKKENDPLVKCCMAQCERAFHPTCCKYWPQSKFTISKSHIESFRCPSHVCHTCVSDDPKGKFQHLSNAKLTKCVKCPATFHTDSTCIPAGSQILTAAHIICPRHSSAKHDMTVNVNWCFICVKGGQVMCCETCPTAVHVHCLNLPIDANECYICEECESGRMPLYGEMVWAKFNTFRWWPAIILPPTEVPMNIAQKSHNPSDFVVRFFGTHDHGWISRRRVYLYVEGDSSEPPKSKSKSLDLNYTKGVAEAKEVYEIIKAKKLSQIRSNENKEKLHPQPYVRIKANRAVPPVKLHVDMESVSKCECDPREENPCGADTNCLNRVLYHECNPKLCPAGERCQNQMFESRISPRLDVVYMTERGFGLVCREPIKAGTFIIEYVGEVINDNEFQARLQQKSQDRDENFYFLSVEKDYIIDAGPKGNLARFMNHSCDPNCETQKWNVNSLNRVGLFAIKDIPENTELTFNYHWDDLLGNEKKTCYCGSKNCAGQIGGKIKDLETFKEPAVVERVEKINRKVNTNKRPLNNKRLKNKLGSKLMSKAKKTKTITKKMVAVINSAPHKTNKNYTLTVTNTSKSTETTTDKEASTGRLLESPDIFL